MVAEINEERKIGSQTIGIVSLQGKRNSNEDLPGTGEGPKGLNPDQAENFGRSLITNAAHDTRNPFLYKKGGACLTIETVCQGKLQGHWVGDAPIILYKKDKDGKVTFEKITRGHTPDIPEEEARITKAGGEVVRYPGKATRCRGKGSSIESMVSRGVADHDMAPATKADPHNPIISKEPESTKRIDLKKLTEDGSVVYAVASSDGANEQFLNSPEKLAHQLETFFTINSNASAMEVAQFLTTTAYDNGSGDNILNNVSRWTAEDVQRNIDSGETTVKYAIDAHGNSLEPDSGDLIAIAVDGSIQRSLMRAHGVYVPDPAELTKYSMPEPSNRINDLRAIFTGTGAVPLEKASSLQAQRVLVNGEPHIFFSTKDNTISRAAFEPLSGEKKREALLPEPMMDHYIAEMKRSNPDLLPSGGTAAERHLALVASYKRSLTAQANAPQGMQAGSTGQIQSPAPNVNQVNPPN